MCSALFIPAEDSGSRVLSIEAPDRSAPCLCGGCYSKWSHGVTVTFGNRGASAANGVMTGQERVRRVRQRTIQGTSIRLVANSTTWARRSGSRCLDNHSALLRRVVRD